MEQNVKFKLLEMESYASLHQVPIMQKEGIEFLQTYIKEHKVKRILELGSAIGYSAIQMAISDPDVTVDTVERDDVRYQVAQANIKACNLENRIHLFHEDALFFETNQSYDLIFIDAAKAQYIKFFERYESNVKVNGVMISDNLEFHGMVHDIEHIKNRNTRQLVRKILKFRDYLLERKDFETTFYDIGDGIAVSKKLVF
ncbi:putative O-methyltransferase YrrM [Breznakia blatticola]|uniref:Putative O-methyltransferase YrrM n=1 Tax=Breznakia blatticola TaxID=1754012 RepID=A0A4R8A3P3_9FIRM|nr:O-methyltransferase [Breznakia blatticola]TDW24896.1 putative O-methyltransferase YrrM [Breznakia blatticola]